MRYRTHPPDGAEIVHFRLQSPKHLLLLSTLVLVVLASLLGLGYWFAQEGSPGARTPLVVTNGSSQWASDTTTTAATQPFTEPTDQIAVNSVLNGYYTSHAGSLTLGAAITPAFPVIRGWVQFFTAGALLLPTALPNSTPATPADHAIDSLLAEGTPDAKTGVVRLPLLHTLLALGSDAVIGDGLTYVDLRAATNPSKLLVQPASSAAVSLQGTTTRPIFVAEGTRAGSPVGHVIPAAIWNALTRRTVSPDGWQQDWGVPLSEAIPFTTVQAGTTHQMLVQVFWMGALVLDQTSPDASGQPTVAALATGADYLRTVGLPSVALGTRSRLWATTDTAIVSDPAGAATVHVGMNYPLKLLGKTAWAAGTLWYQVQWEAPKNSGHGWVAAPSVTFRDPKQPAWASFDVLSPSLAAYLSSLQSGAAAVVYDVTRGRYYSYNADGQFLMASSIKVPIMLAFFTMVEQEGREPTDDEQYLLTTMIENSDNDSATALFDEIGDADGLAHYLAQINVSGLTPQDGDWGYSLTSPLAMVRLLTLLHDGKVLTSAHRQQALDLMENIEDDEQVGVGDTAPAGATVAMKDGWVPGPDDLWAMNSSGILSLGHEVYIIAVYSQEQNSLDDGWAITRTVCQTVANILL